MFDPDLWKQFVGWVQFVAAILTIILTPRALGILKRILRRQLFASGRTSWKFVPAMGFEWEVEFKNKSRQLQNHEIFVFPRALGNRVNSIWVVPSSDPLVGASAETITGKGFLKVAVWPSGRKVIVKIRTESPDLLDFHSETQDVDTQLFYPRFVPSQVRSDRVPGRERISIVHMRQYLLTMARSRVFLLLGYIPLVATVMIARIAYLGLSQ